MKRLDLSGQRFDMLTVLYRVENTARGVSWECICDCGNHVIRSTHTLRETRVHSCGCYEKRLASSRVQEINKSSQGKGNPNYRHGGADTRLYWVWSTMIQRCNNPKNKNYSNYGGRGIGVCEGWEKSFAEFQAWAANNGYSDGLSIDRIDNDKGYFPENCRWVTAKVQSNNRRKRRWFRKPKEVIECQKQK